MKLCYLLIFLFIIAGCGDETSSVAPIVEKGEIFGSVTNKETGEPVKGASVDIGGRTALTDEKGKYSLKDMPLSDNMKITVTAANYNEYTNVVSLRQELMSFDVSLIPVESPSAPILAVLNAISKDVEALDPAKGVSVQSYFTKDYTVANDEATAFGILAGVIPPTYDKIPETIGTIAKKYNKLEFRFTNPDVKFDGDKASALVRFMVKAETNPPEPKSWEIIVDARFDFQKQNDGWKITFWQLVPPFLKFEEKPL